MRAVTAGVDRHELRQITAGVSEGVIPVEPDRTIAYANAAALAMRGAGRPEPDFVHSLCRVDAIHRDGRPNCLALIPEDATDQFETEDRFEATSDVNPAPAVITRLSDCRHGRVNTGLLKMIGFTRDAVSAVAQLSRSGIADTLHEPRIG